MANPTTSKPANPEWDSATNANLQFLCVFDRNTAPVDLVGSVPAKTYDGYGGYNTGLAPTPATATFGGVTAQKTFKWGNGAASLMWPGRGWAAGTSVATPRTLAITFRHSIQAGKNAAGSNNTPYTVAILDSGSDGNMMGLELQGTADGVVTLRLRRSSSQLATDLCGGKTFDAGTWYTVFVTLTSSTGRTSNYYDHAAQSAGLQATLVDSSYSFGSGAFANNVVICNTTGQGGYTSGEIEVYAACLANESWDTGTNPNKFSDFYTDPALWARGTYAPSASTLVAGVAAAYVDTVTGISVGCSRPTGGASSGVYTYQWHRSQSGPTFTPVAGTLIAGATSKTYTDTATNPGELWYYKCAQSDGSATVYTNHVAAYRVRGILRSLLIGDSLTTAGSTAPHARCSMALMTRWRHSWVNRAHGARFVGVASITTGGQSLKPGHWTLQPTAASVTAGTYTLTWRGQTTSALAYNASAATIQTALVALSTVGANNATVIGSGTPATNNAYGILFSGAALSGGVVSGDVLTVDSTGVTGGPMTVWSEYRNAVLAGLNDLGGIDEVDIHIGTNDAGLLASSAATFGTDLSYLCTKLFAEGFTRIRLHSPPYRWQGNSDATSELIRQYETTIDGLCNGTTIRRGAKLLQWSSGDNNQMDGLHSGLGGWTSMGVAQWLAILADLDPSNPTLAGSRVIGG